MKNYGLPYMGSKNKIARDIVSHLPPGEVFVDLFAGGCAITHAAMESGKYKHVIANDINGQYPRLFRDAVTGNLPPQRVYTREEFLACKDTDPIAALCWSFGNNPEKLYLWGKEIERVKLTACRMILAETWQERRMLYKSFMQMLKPENFEHNMERLERLQSMERLERLQSLESFESLLTVSALDYREVEIPEGSVVYADPPYADTEGYAGNKFSHADFYAWLRAIDSPVYVSEYKMPDDFTTIWERRKTCFLDYRGYNRNNKQTVEKLFVRRDFAEQARTAAGMLF